MNPREIALALAVTSVIADAAAQRKEQLRGQLLEALDDLGVDAVRAELPTGEKVAKTSLIIGKDKARVTDSLAFAKWVQRDTPDAVIVTLNVVPAYEKLVLASCRPGPDGLAIHAETGEIVPGVSMSTSAPYVSTRFEKDGREAIIAALRNGDVALDRWITPELEAGEA